MEIAEKYVYLLAIIPPSLIWIFIFLKRKDLRKEMLVMSTLIGIVSPLTSYFWWTIDWWKPLTLTNTIVGVEDFILGFASGGIMATIYEVIFKRGLYKRKLHHHISGGFTLIFLMSQTTMILFWGIGLTSFWSGAIAMLLVASIMIYIRQDLIKNSLISGILMLLVSIPIYLVILLISPQWIDNTYLSGLSGIRFIGVPVEEFVFWFIAGLVFGPFYEYWQGERLKALK